MSALIPIISTLILTMSALIPIVNTARVRPQGHQKCSALAERQQLLHGQIDRLVAEAAMVSFLPIDMQASWLSCWLAGCLSI